MHKLFSLASATALGLAAALALNPIAAGAEPEAARAEALPLQQLRTFAEIFGRIKNDYVEEVDDQKLLEYAIRGMLEGLDPHSAYLSEDEFKELQVGTRGEFGGLGIEVGMEDGFVKVIAPIDDTPAQRAGIEAGDLIVRLDDRPLKGMSLNEAVKLMRGKPGSSITLTVVRKGRENPLQFTLVRDVIKVASVRGRLLEPGFGYVRISQFQSRTADDLTKVVGNLRRDSDDGLRGLILDLRNNPGGVLNAAVSVSDAFLESGLIVYTKGRVDDSELRFQAAADDLIDGAPMVVLVNAGSASASEIVAGALQDQKRAVIMGQRTFGKGSVQTIIPINRESGIKLTTARYYTPSGRSIQAAGIEPDIVLEDLEVNIAKGHGQVPAIKEADLTNHLENDVEPSTAPRPMDAAAPPGSARDYALGEALNLLKGLDILQARGS